MDEQKKNATISTTDTNEGNLLTGPQTRREFLLKGMTLAAALPLVLAVDSFSRTARAKAPKIHWVNPKDGQAKALGYTIDANKVDVKKFPQRAGAKGKDQFCWNCLRYTPVPAVAATKSAKGSCSIFNGEYVHEGAWCMMWAQNPKYTGKKHV